jgi:hypothetical protein
MLDQTILKDYPRLEAALPKETEIVGTGNSALRDWMLLKAAVNQEEVARRLSLPENH